MKKFAAILVSLLLVFAMASVALADTITMVTNVGFPPYEYWDGDVEAGIDVEIARAVAAKMGYDLVIDDQQFKSCISNVSEGKADFCMGGVTVTDERKLVVDFSQTYAQGVQVIIVLEGSPIQSIDDLLADGTAYVIGTQEGTTGNLYTTWDYEDAGKDTDLIKGYNTGMDAVMALKNGQVDCVVIDSEPAKTFVAMNEGLVILDTEYIVEDYAAVLRKGNDEFNAAFCAALQELMDDGTVAAIIAKYINAD